MSTAEIESWRLKLKRKLVIIALSMPAMNIRCKFGKISSLQVLLVIIHAPHNAALCRQKSKIHFLTSEFFFQICHLKDIPDSPWWFILKFFAQNKLKFVWRVGRKWVENHWSIRNTLENHVKPCGNHQMKISHLKRKMLWVVNIFLFLRYPTSILIKRSCDFLWPSEIFEIKNVVISCKSWFLRCTVHRADLRLSTSNGLFSKNTQNTLRY